LKVNYRQVVYIGVLALLLFFYQFAFVPGRKKLHALEQQQVQKTKDYQLLTRLAGQYRESLEKQSGQEIRPSPASFSLLSFVVDLLESAGLKANVKEIKPLPEQLVENFVFQRVRLALADTSLESIYGFLQKLESSPAVYVPNFQLKRNKDKPFLVSAELELLVIKTLPKK
jgi:hypothetical protein